MTITEYIKDLAKSDYAQIDEKTVNAISHFQETTNYKDITKYINELKEDELSVLGDKLSKPLRFCRTNLESKEISLNRKLLQNTKKFKEALEEVQDIIAAEGRSRKQMQDIASIGIINTDVFKELRKNLVDSKKEIGDLRKEIKDLERENNSRIFNLLLNTIAILGIFVAIAFGGVGSLNVIEALPFDVEQGIPTNAFYLSLGALFVYNLLFLLFYCIFKILESFDKVRFKSFSTNFKAFIWIDAIGVIFMLSMLALVLWKI